jgi:FkbM family methyltransferase
MRSRFSRFLFDHRARLKPLVVVRRPILLRLPTFKLYVRLDDWAVGARIAVKRTYEQHVTTVMQQVLQPGMVVLDIGANIGYYTMLAAAQVGPTGKVLAFEPLRANSAMLQASREANGFAHVHILPYAVAEQDGSLGFREDDSNGVLALDNPTTAAYEVQAVALDTFLADEPRIDVVKMDIEGAEGLALRGMQQLLRHHRPLVFSEFSWNTLRQISGMEPETFLDLLRAPGYEVGILPRRGGPSTAPQTNEQIMRYCRESGERDHLDLLARPVEQPRDTYPA